MRDRSLESMPSGGHVAGAAASPTRALILATISFALSFAAWGLVGGLASVFTGLYGLTASADRAPGGGAGAARLAGAAADGHADGSIRRTPRLHGAPRVLVARRIRRAADRQLRLAARGGVSHRHGGIVLRGRSRVRVSLDAGGSAGHGPRRLRAGDDGAIAGRLRRPGGRGSPGLGGGVSRHQRGAPGLGGRVLPAWRGIPRRPGVPPRSPR